MRILIIADEEWNDYVYGNNVLTNWFSGFNADFAEIYCSPGIPCNNVCKRYFQVTDMQMFKSLLGGKKAGSTVTLPVEGDKSRINKTNVQRQGGYLILKKLSLHIHTVMMLIRDFIWCNGRYNIKELKHFIDDFNPDIVFCPRFISPKLMRLEKIVSTMTSAKFIAFTADDEASLHQMSFSPLYWLRRLWIRGKFREHVKLYSHYFTFSKEQAEDYTKEYKIPTSTLYKCGDFSDTFYEKTVGKPIQMVYAGRLYCGRWRTLGKVGEALRLINKDGVKVVLNVYSQENITSSQKHVLNESNYVYCRGAVSASELTDIYKKSDIALHVESFEKKYAYATRVSFSTKIIDLMASSCAIIAICWEKHAGYQYLKENDAAFCINNYDDILPMIKHIIDNPQMITKMARKAWECGIEHHKKEKIQKQLNDVFDKYIH